MAVNVLIDYTTNNKICALLTYFWVEMPESTVAATIILSVRTKQCSNF